MNKIRVTKEFNFEMAHALYGYDGPCKNIHGHSYRLAVTIIGNVNEDNSDSKNGMVVDFSELKCLVTTAIVNPFDHALLLNKNSPHKNFSDHNKLFEKVELVDYQPTCENMLIDFAKKIKKILPPNNQLHHLLLRETSNSYAEWFAEDNKDTRV